MFVSLILFYLTLNFYIQTSFILVYKYLRYLFAYVYFLCRFIIYHIQQHIHIYIHMCMYGLLCVLSDKIAPLHLLLLIFWTNFFHLILFSVVFKICYFCFCLPFSSSLLSLFVIFNGLIYLRKLFFILVFFFSRNIFLIFNGKLYILKFHIQLESFLKNLQSKFVSSTLV